ncbi:MAG: flagellar FlbD family protein [Firmicutes bacterium]|nr:flagellar FlbD family protein [Bacillota bacterium]
MIALTRMSGIAFVVNAPLIELVESTPDTVITLVSGRKYVVRETASEIATLVTDYYRSIGLLATAGACGHNAHGGKGGESDV